MVVRGVNADLSRVVTTDGVGGEDKLKRGVINARHVARATRLVLLWAKSEGVHVDTSVWRACVALVRLY